METTAHEIDVADVLHVQVHHPDLLLTNSGDFALLRDQDSMLLPGQTPAKALCALSQGLAASNLTEYCE